MSADLLRATVRIKQGSFSTLPGILQTSGGGTTQIAPEMPPTPGKGQESSPFTQASTQFPLYKCLHTHEC